jgi:hypothetical protein
MKNLVFVPTWNFLYSSLVDPKGPRFLDFLADNPEIDVNTWLVYTEFAIDNKTPKFTERFAIRSVKQVLRGFPAVKKGCIALLLEKVFVWPWSLWKIHKEVRNRAKEFSVLGGKLPEIIR